MSEDTDTPADERCDDCGRLDPINCPCEPDDDTDSHVSCIVRGDFAERRQS